MTTTLNQNKMNNLVDNYISQLKEALDTANISPLKRKAALATIRGQWKDRSLSSFNHWRYSGETQHFEYMQFCGQIAKGIETIA